MHDLYDYERGIPFGYFITFRPFGTWLPGDARGSIDRVHNVFGSPRLPPNPAQWLFSTRLVGQAPVYLGPARGEATRLAIVEYCESHNWHLRALNVRTTHVHVVVTTTVPATRVLSALKAQATTRMRLLRCWSGERSPWSKGGSTRVLWHPNALARAIEYVLHRQGPDLD